jgi:hypothetical protein
MLKVAKPSPKWYRIFNTVYPIVENAVIAGAMIYDIEANAKGLLVFKLASSTIRQVVDAVIEEK